MAHQKKGGILLESGTNEVEILEFMVHGQYFGINVAKIQEIVQFQSSALTKMPQQPPSITGGFLLRKQMLLLVDLSQHLFNIPSVTDDTEGNRRVVLVTEFNFNKTGFLLESVNRIHRCTWEQLVPLNSYASNNGIAVLGTIRIDDHDVVILDLESLLAQLIPSFSRLDHMGDDDELDESDLGEGGEGGEGDTDNSDGIPSPARTASTVAQAAKKDAIMLQRAQCHLYIAEDSTYIREHLVRNLKSIGYSNVSEFSDGQSAYEALEALHKESSAQGQGVEASLSAIITDIEMPRLDGLSLCNRLRNQLNIHNIPVIMFSSLVTAHMQKKCTSVGGNACLNKAEASQLVDLLDQFCLAP